MPALLPPHYLIQCSTTPSCPAPLHTIPACSLCHVFTDDAPYIHTSHRLPLHKNLSPLPHTLTHIPCTATRQSRQRTKPNCHLPLICLMLLALLPLMTAQQHGLDTAGKQQHGPWPAPRLWALRGAEFTGNSSLSHSTVKSNSDALIAQALHSPAMDFTRSQPQLLLRVAGALLLTSAYAGVCVGALWGCNLRPRRRLQRISGYKRGGSAQRRKKNFNLWRWWVRWTP